MSHFGALGLLMSQSGVYEIRPNNAVSRFTSNDLQQIEWASVPGYVTSDDIDAIAKILRERLSPGELIVLTKLLA